MSLVIVSSQSGEDIDNKKIASTNKSFDSKCARYFPKSNPKNEMVYEVDELSDLISPERVTFCDILLKNEDYKGIIMEYSSANIIKIKKELFGKKIDKDFYLFSGVPTGVFNIKKKSGDVFIGEVSTDDCGYNGDEIFDEDCPSGNGLMRINEKEILLVSEVFKRGKEYKNNLLEFYNF